MSVKVKRGLGLLVVAAIGYLVIAGVREGGPEYSATEQAFEALAWTLAAVGLAGGLGLLAWGLLRD